MLTVAIAAASGGCHTGRRTPSCPPSPCTRTGHCTDGDLGRTLRGQLRHFGLVVGLELGHLAPQHRDVGLGLPQQRLQLDVLLQIGHSCLSVVTAPTHNTDLVSILQLLPGVVVLLLVLAHPLVHLLEQPGQHSDGLGDGPGND